MKVNKQTYATIFIFFAITLMVLPVVVSVNELLTKIVEQNLLYIWIQTHIVPLEARMMGALLMPFGYRFAFSPSNSIIVVNGLNLQITWNCLGWQGMLLLLISFFTGLRKKYALNSKLEAITLGLLGTFWINILRMLFTVLLAVHLPPVFRIIFHNYLAAFVSVLWLFAFWWFSHTYILRPSSIKKSAINAAGE